MDKTSPGQVGDFQKTGKFSSDKHPVIRTLGEAPPLSVDPQVEVSIAHGRRSSLAVHLLHFQLRCGQETLLGVLVMVSEAIQPEPGLRVLMQMPPLRHVH